MDASESHFIGLVWASIVIVFFSVVATIIIVTWSSMLPEAIAVDMNRDTNKVTDVIKATNDFSPYVALHETESWHFTAALHDPIAIAHCPR